ncbi:transposase [Nitrospirales bacterium NOB]|nr:MAG: Transposase [Nitrospira sp. OLB3]MBV6471200.1 hypothetical protein [Nitrospirota bacterium]MCE7964678.1 transposase [Nitrospira sp. NTP2]MDL1890149.1 transposase [Nitrospirales bacterium NOB]QOJ35197.1 MAG: transposase [Nitrospira sp.]
MERRKFAREFKLEAVKLVRERGVTAAQAARDLGVQAPCYADGSRSMLPIRSRPFPVRDR